MLLENYFNFVNETCIRIKDTRVGIETVIKDYENGASPEEIVLHYPTLSLEQVHATILYYLANKEQVQDYIERVHKQSEDGYARWLQDAEGGASDFIRELRKRFAARQAEMNPHKPERIANEAPLLVG